MASKRYCAGCCFDPAERVGEAACPFTTLYWDFLARHGDLLAQNPRMEPQVRNLARLTAEERSGITERAAAIRRGEVGPSAVFHSS